MIREYEVIPDTFCVCGEPAVSYRRGEPICFDCLFYEETIGKESEAGDDENAI
jgi:hypothetical protein